MQEREVPRQFPQMIPFIIPLSNSELTELGVFVAIWGQIDFLLYQILTLLISSNSKFGGAYIRIMSESLTTGPRVNLVRRFCELDRSDKTKKKICNLLKKHAGLIKDRNNIIHGVWGIAWGASDSDVHAASAYQADEKPPLKAEKIEVLANRAAEFANELFFLHQELVDIKWQGSIPHRLFFGQGPRDPADRPPLWPPRSPADSA